MLYNNIDLLPVWVYVLRTRDVREWIQYLYRYSQESDCAQKKEEHKQRRHQQPTGTHVKHTWHIRCCGTYCTYVFLKLNEEISASCILLASSNIVHVVIRGCTVENKHLGIRYFLVVVFHHIITLIWRERSYKPPYAYCAEQTRLF